MNHAELHHLTTWQRFEHSLAVWCSSFLAVFALLGAYATVQLWDERVELSAEVARLKALACPDELDGKPFKFSAHERVNVLRPGTSRLSCYYGAAK